MALNARLLEFSGLAHRITSLLVKWLRHFVSDKLRGKLWRGIVGHLLLRASAAIVFADLVSQADKVAFVVVGGGWWLRLFVPLLQ